MSAFKCYRLVILPRAFSIILPAIYSNEVIILMKGTALASTTRLS